MNTGGCIFAAIPDVEIRPEMEFRQEPEIDNPVEVTVSVITTCGGDLGAARPGTTERPSERPDFTSKYVLGDRPEATVTFSSLASQETIELSSDTTFQFPHHSRPKSYFLQTRR